MTPLAALRRPSSQFTLASLFIVSACVLLMRTAAFARNPDLASWAATFDLTLTIPLVWYFVMVRSGAARPITIAPVFVGCITFAAFVVPRGHQQVLHQLHFLSVPLDVVTIGLIARRMFTRRNDATIEADPLLRIQRTTRQILGGRGIATFVAMEIAVSYYALFTWRTKATRRENDITVHERVGWGSIVVCILVLLVAESIGVHFLVRLWSPGAALALLFLDVYGMLWLIGDYHALRLRTTRVENDTLELRYGLRWTATIPIDEIASIDTAIHESDWKRRGVLKMALLDEPRYLIRLSQSHVVHGPAGITRSIDTIAILPDDDQAFRRAFAME